MNPFQHSAVAATVFTVLDNSDLRLDQDQMGDLAVKIAHTLAQTHKGKLGKPPDDLADYIGDPRCNFGLMAAFVKSLHRVRVKPLGRGSKSHARGQSHR
jgi:hypothetical protein